VPDSTLYSGLSGICPEKKRSCHVVERHTFHLQRREQDGGGHPPAVVAEALTQSRWFGL
jgi:hypothetical protein